MTNKIKPAVGQKTMSEADTLFHDDVLDAVALAALRYQLSGDRALALVACLAGEMATSVEEVYNISIDSALDLVTKNVRMAAKRGKKVVQDAA